MKLLGRRTWNAIWVTASWIVGYFLWLPLILIEMLFFGTAYSFLVTFAAFAVVSFTVLICFIDYCAWTASHPCRLIYIHRPWYQGYYYCPRHGSYPGPGRWFTRKNKRNV
jgi:hypothetical protein